MTVKRSSPVVLCENMGMAHSSAAMMRVFFTFRHHAIELASDRAKVTYGRFWIFCVQTVKADYCTYVKILFVPSRLITPEPRLIDDIEFDPGPIEYRQLAPIWRKCKCGITHLRL